MTSIEIESLSKVYGEVKPYTRELLTQGLDSEQVKNKTGQLVSLNNINLTIKPGEFHVVMGLSGSGKSTLLRHLNGLLMPTLGSVLIDGEDITRLNTRQLRQFRQIKCSMVFQHYGLLPHYTVFDNIAFGLNVQAGWSKLKATEVKVNQWIERVGLRGFEQAYPSELSGGMQQRVGLARALATETDMLLLDEAFSGLDPLIRREMQDLLIKLQSMSKRTVIFITHDLDEALRLGDRVTILQHGQIAQTGSPRQIIQNPANNYVRRFVEHVNRAQLLTVAACMQPCSENELTKDIVDKVELALPLEKALIKLIECNSSLAVVDSQQQIVGKLVLEDVLAALK